MVLSSTVFADAASKKPSHPAGGAAPGLTLTTPFPVRSVILQQIQTKAFQLPNGSTTNLSADLQSILNTAVTSTTAFSPTDPFAADPCNTHLEIRSAVTSFDLDIAEVGISIGYSPDGQMGPVTGINGSVNAKIGNIAMDFSVWECDDSKCSSVAATTANHVTAGVNLSLMIDFAMVKTGPQLIYNTSIADALRKIMMKGMFDLSASARLNALSWKSRVREYIPNVGVLIFDAGFQSRLAPNQAFVVYAATDASVTGACHVFKPMAYIHTTSVDTVSSAAVVDQVLDSRGVQDGDVVMIRQVSAK
jgi:hypothetical protein